MRNEEISEAHMFLILPHESGEQAFLKVEQNLIDLDWQSVFEKMDLVYGNIQLPRLMMEFQTNLAPILSNMGMEKLFSGQGSRDFAGITPEWNEFRLDTLQHKTVQDYREGNRSSSSYSSFYVQNDAKQSCKIRSTILPVHL